jgi:hypothetical protein
MRGDRRIPGLGHPGLEDTLEAGCALHFVPREGSEEIPWHGCLSTEHQEARGRSNRKNVEACTSRKCRQAFGCA